jgi:hypothetical protein
MDSTPPLYQLKKLVPPSSHQRERDLLCHGTGTLQRIVKMLGYTEFMELEYCIVSFSPALDGPELRVEQISGLLNRYGNNKPPHARHESFLAVIVDTCTTSIRVGEFTNYLPSPVIVDIFGTICLWLYSPFVGPWPLFQFLNPIPSR